jgi:hypothetical protein
MNEPIRDINISIFERMLSCQTDYFQMNSKNNFFKKNQKFDCAKYVCNNNDINKMIETAVFIIPEKNIIFVDYVIFKIFANDDNYDRIIDHIMNLFDYAIKYYGSFEVNLNLRTFSVSSAERFIPAISKFCKRCLSHHTNYTEHMSFFRILNTPSVMEMIIKIVKPVVEKDVLAKLSFLSKDETNKFCNNNNYSLISDSIQK